MSPIYNILFNQDDCHFSVRIRPDLLIIDNRSSRGRDISDKCFRCNSSKRLERLVEANPRTNRRRRNFLSVVCPIWTGIQCRQQSSCHMQRECQIRRLQSWFNLSHGVNFGEHVTDILPIRLRLTMSEVSLQSCTRGWRLWLYNILHNKSRHGDPLAMWSISWVETCYSAWTTSWSSSS